ncbi:hypothetical protein C8236_06565 [Paracidovorax avenae]|uniref:FRG domain-containing protein n=1 Tax=Paracidovorax avenae TaxID=80867 RepID=UPI000D2147A1|nr:FRG domain-containing protein [Paracidovorax avenae]AVS98535.1 hypothetical protein C8236_06565 [Paracidovorax avenae]
MFTTIRFSSWEELRRAFGRRPLWVFRGQADAQWLPETTLYREAQRQKAWQLGDLRSRESWMLYQFQRFAHHHRGDLPRPEGVADWLALIQHYGGPTRLLDFTYSLYVSAFFATESAAGEAAIWCIDTDAICCYAKEKLNAHSFGSIHEIRFQMTKRFNELRVQAKVPLGVLHVEPDKMHERMYQQQGLFMAPTNPDRPFLENLAAMLECDASLFQSNITCKWSKKLDQILRMEHYEERMSVVKLLLPREWHEEILEDLRYMNITAATLFPGLEGFARSLRLHL